MSNLKFYSQSIDELPVVCDKGDAAGHPIEYLKDRLLASYWQSAATSADQIIDIDFGAAADIDHCLLLHDIQLTAGISLWSASAANYSDEVQRSASYAAITADYMLIPTVGGTVHKYRYWRLKISGLSAAPKIYLMFMGLSKEITIRYDKGYTDHKIYAGNSLVETYSGMRYSRRNQTAGRRRLEYSWEMLDVTNAAKLQAIIEDTQGAALPFFLKLEDDTYLYVRLMNDNIANPEFEYQLYNISKLVFEEEF
jgi:hypothetical protein